MSSRGTSQPAPLEPQTFFTGTWRGEGDLIPHWLIRPIVSRQRIQYEGRTSWSSPSTWQVHDRLLFASGQVIELHLGAEIVGERGIHVTSPMMPGGADILLDEEGFDFTPYLLQVKQWGLTLHLRCIDTNRLLPSGVIMDTIKMYWLGLLVATLQLWITVDRGASE